MSYVASETRSPAPSPVLPQSARSSFANDSASSGSFDDILNTIPDAAPPAPPAPSADPAPPPARATDSRPAPSRADRSDRAAASDRADRDAKTDDKPVPAADKTPSKDAAPAPTDKAVAADKPAGDKKTDSTDKPAEDAKTASDQAAAAALVPQAVAIDPVPVIAATIGAGAAISADKAATATAAIAATAMPGAAVGQAAAKTGNPQNAATPEPAAALSAEDADVLSALAAKAQQGLKDGQAAKTEKTDKTDTKTVAADKTAQTVKTTNDAPAPLDPAAQQASADGAATESTAAKPGHADIAKLAVESHRGGEADKSPAADTAATATNAAAKTPDAALPQVLVPVPHSAQAAATNAVTGTASSSDKDAPVSISGVAVEITSKIASGKNQFDIRLDPPELGKIHVKINVDRDGNVITHMVADRTDTLDLLRRDTQGLERALQDAGLKTSDNSMQFSLRDQSAQQQQQNQQGSESTNLIVEDEQPVTNAVIARDYGRYTLRPSGIDIRV